MLQASFCLSLLAQLALRFQSVPVGIYVLSCCIALCLPIRISPSLPPLPAFAQSRWSLPLPAIPLFLPSLWFCVPPCLSHPITGFSLLRPSWTSCTRQGSCILCPPGWSCTQQSALMSALPTCWASRVRQPGYPSSGLASCPAILSTPPLPAPVLDPTPRPWEAAAARPPSLPPPQAPPHRT